MKQPILCITLAALALAASSPVLAAYPERPVRVIVPYSPGGTSDFVGRLESAGSGEELVGIVEAIDSQHV